MKFVRLAATVLLAGWVPATISATEQETFVSSLSTGDPAAQTFPGMKFIPAGKAKVGLSVEQILAINLSNLGELKALVASSPEQEMTVEAFYMDVNEVTNQQWLRYLEATGQKPSKDLVENYWKDGKIPAGHENRPLVFVSKREAEDYARWCMKRLPTEFEWEYAARGPQGWLYPWGNEFDDPAPEKGKEQGAAKPIKGGQRASCGSTGGKVESRPVGERDLGVSPFGIHDMAGNVWEWTSSRLELYPGNKPIRIKNRYIDQEVSGIDFAKQVVIRGGAFDSKGVALMSAVRQPIDTPDGWYSTIGFRCVRSARPGADAVEYALEKIGRYRFEALSELNLNGIIALENYRHDADGSFLGYDGIVLCPVKNWVERGRPMSLSKAMGEGEIPLGALTTTHDMVVPALKAGSYFLTLRPANKKAKVAKDAVFPDKGWNYPGSPEMLRASAKAEQDKKKAERKNNRRGRDDQAEEPAEDEAAGAEGDETGAADAPTEPAAPDIPVYPGDLPVDPRKDQIVVFDPVAQKVVASFVVGDLKEHSRGTVDQPLARRAIAEDKVNKIPATEEYTFQWNVDTGGRRFVTFELPIRFAPKLYED